jgi:hypothetical protein
MLTQNLPPSASSYARQQRLEQQAAISAITREWSRMGNNFDLSWLRIAPTVVQILERAQSRVIDGADRYIPAVLADTNQVDDQITAPNTRQLIGFTGAGQPLDLALALTPIRAKQAVAKGASEWQALKDAGHWLTSSAGLLLSDTGRAAEGLNMYARQGGGGFVRMLTPPSCGRCVVLAGKWFRHNEGFSRHPPTCDCRHIPASEAVAADLTIDPDEYFHSLDKAGQNKMAGSIANADAIRDGADIGQIINAYRRTAGMQFAHESGIKTNARGSKFTTEGTSRRGLAGMQQAGLRRNGPAQQRLMPETIAMRAKDADDRMRLLKLYGWVRDDAASARGRTIFAEQRRVERNARARARRSESREVTPNPATAGAGGAAQAGGGGATRGRPGGDSRAYWKARQDSLPVDFSGERLEPQEVVFAERFIGLGHHPRWIPKDTVARRSTNDFEWTNNGGIEVELKATRATYKAIHGRIVDAASRAMRNHGVVKSNFMIDLGTHELTAELREQLTGFNVGRRKYRIERLWVLDRAGLHEIVLRT